MIAGHYPLAFASSLNWLIFGLILVCGAAIRHFFNEHHAGRHAWWSWGVAAIAALLAVWISSFPKTGIDLAAGGIDRDEIEAIVLSRCSMCHAREPFWEGIAAAPKNVIFEDWADIEKHAAGIYLQAAHSHAMPPGNITELEESERQLIAAWYLSRS
jgi:uncharacterized membrane protein